MEAGKPDRKIIQVRDDDVTDDMLVAKLVCSGPTLDIFLIDVKGYADGVDIRRRGVEDGSRVWGLSNQKDGVLIIRNEKIKSRLGFGRKVSSSVLDVKF